MQNDGEMSAKGSVENRSSGEKRSSFEKRSNVEKESSIQKGSSAGKKSFAGRGAFSNPSNRYNNQSREAFYDDWWLPEETAIPKTQVYVDRGNTIISTNQSPDIPFDQSINPYRGCEHGCIYCYARPSHTYWDFSPGLDFETKIITRPNAATLLRKTLTKPNYQCKVINIGANTDPYQPLEAKIKTTREILEVLQEQRHPVSLITKSSLVIRDLDILSEMAADKLCSVAIRVTTLNNDLKRILEPRTANGSARLRTLKQLSGAGIPFTLMVAPVIPFINDHEIEHILEQGSLAGAKTASMILLRLPREVSPLFQEWLEEHFPDKADHVMSLVRSARQGKDYQSGYHTRMRGEGDYANMLQQRFRVALRKFGFSQAPRFSLDCSQFKRGFDQMSLF